MIVTISASFRSCYSNNGKMWNAILFLQRHNRHRVCFCSLDSELPPKSLRWAYDQLQCQDWVHDHAARGLPPLRASAHQQSNVGTAQWIPARFQSQPIRIARSWLTAGRSCDRRSSVWIRIPGFQPDQAWLIEQCFITSSATNEAGRRAKDRIISFRQRCGRTELTECIEKSNLWRFESRWKVVSAKRH